MPKVEIKVIERFSYEQFKQGRSHEPMTVSGLYEIIDRLGEWARVTGVRCFPHTFRHTYAMNYLRQGGDIYRLSRLLGYATREPTQIYLRAFRQEDARWGASVLDTLGVTSCGNGCKMYLARVHKERRNTLTSGTAEDEFRAVVTPEQERAFQELLRGARMLRGWSQDEAAAEAAKKGLSLRQTLISSLEHGPYPKLAFWDISKLCRLYGIPIQQVADVLGWSDAKPESKFDQRMSLILDAVRDLPESDADSILMVIERFVIGTRAKPE